MLHTLVDAVIERHFATGPQRVTRMSFGHSSSEVYDVVLPQRQVMVKINYDPKALEGIQKNIATLAKLGLPVSKVLHADISRTQFPVAYVLLEKIPGKDLRYELETMSKAQMTTLAEQIVTFQRRVMSLSQGRGFGWVPVGEVAPFASWTDIVQRDLVRGREALERLGQRQLYQQIEMLTRTFNDYFLEIRPVCFLDDITTKNVIVEKGQLSGLVDFDVVCYGDPLFWLALTQTAVIADVGASGQLYIDELIRCWNASPIEKHVIQFYTLLHAMGFVEFAARSNDSATCERLLEWMKTFMN
jgi:aminoglycoside phosphotransferase (APT) family kinase protein